LKNHVVLFTFPLVATKNQKYRDLIIEMQRVGSAQKVTIDPISISGTGVTPTKNNTDRGEATGKNRGVTNVRDDEKATILS